MKHATPPPDFIEQDATWPLDNGDFAMLAELTRHARPRGRQFLFRANTIELAGLTSLSPKTVRTRLRRLQGAGYLRHTFNIEGSVIDLTPFAQRLQHRSRPSSTDQRQ